MGYIDEDGAYIHEEGDLADPGVGFSELLNLGTRHVPQLVHNRVVAELGEDPTIRDHATELFDEMVEERDLAEVERHEDSEWAWGHKSRTTNRVSLGELHDGTLYPPILNIDAAAVPEVEYADRGQGWLFANVARGTRRVISGIRLDGSIYPPPAHTIDPLVIHGDSIAAGWTAQAPQLAAATGRPVLVEGIGGQQSNAIAARHGARAALITVAGNVLPPAGPVTVTAITEPDGTALNLLRGPGDGTRFRDGILAGVPGRLVSVQAGAENSYRFEYAPLPAPGAIAAGTPFVTGLPHRDAVTIILAPRNDFGSTGGWRQPLEKILARYRAMVAGNRSGRVLILSVLPSAGDDAAGAAARATLNGALRTEFPELWCDWLPFLQSDAAFTAAGIAKTADDAADIAAGWTPRSLRGAGDPLHLNAAGYAAANAYLTRELTSRGLTT